MKRLRKIIYKVGGDNIVDIDKLLADAPKNFVIVDALAKCVEVVGEHQKIMCSISGGATVM